MMKDKSLSPFKGNGIHGNLWLFLKILNSNNFEIYLWLW